MLLTDHIAIWSLNLPSGISQDFWLHNILSSSMQLKCFLFISAHFFWKWIEAEKLGTCLLCVHEIWLSANRFSIGKAMIHIRDRIFRLPPGQALCWRSSTFSQSGNLGMKRRALCNVGFHHQFIGAEGAMMNKTSPWLHKAHSSFEETDYFSMCYPL